MCLISFCIHLTKCLYDVLIRSDRHYTFVYCICARTFIINVILYLFVLLCQQLLCAVLVYQSCVPEVLGIRFVLLDLKQSINQSIKIRFVCSMIWAQHCTNCHQVWGGLHFLLLDGAGCFVVVVGWWVFL